jgi:hypothetical protein
VRGAEKNDDRGVQQHREQHEPHEGELGRLGIARAFAHAWPNFLP